MKYRSVTTKHIGNIFKSGELDEQVVCTNFAHTANGPLSEKHATPSGSGIMFYLFL